MKRISVATAILLALAAGASQAHAAVINVRIEGASSTLFEGPVVTTGRNVQSLSERSTGAIRRCDGTNNDAGSTIVPTGTAATADALSILGQGFDGDWYEQYQDYLIARLGNETASWRLFKNGVFSAVGGCQMKLAEGNEVLWARQAGAPLGLSLSGSTVTVSPAAAGAEIYEASADGAQGATLGTTDGAGQFTVTGLAAGWHRIKARSGQSVRSNRVNLCVAPCGSPPSDLTARVPPAAVFYGPGGQVLPRSETLARTITPLKITRPVAGRSAYRRGRIAVRWRIAREGTGLLRWAIASDDLSTKAKRYATRARGTTQTSTALALPAGRVHALRFTSTDRLNRDDAIDFGRVLVPIDDRSKQVKRRGSWRKARSSSAWKGTLLRGGRGARLTVALAAGRPALVLGGKGRATVRIGSKTVRARGGRTVYGPKRRKAGRVTIAVTRGSILLDGVAASP